MAVRAPMDGWLVGVLLILIGCLCSAIGLVLMKHSTNVETALPLISRPYFWTGFLFLMTNAMVIDVIAFSLAPLSLVAPFSGITIVFTTWLASSGLLFIKETVDVYDVTSTCVALVGVTLTSIFGPHVSDVHDASELYSYMTKPGFRAFVAASLAALGLLWTVFVSGAGELRAAMWYRIVVFAYTSALFGSISMLLLKIVGSGIRAALETDSAFPDGFHLICILTLAGCAMVQLGFLHMTLANSPVSYGVPMYQTLLTVLSIIAGGIYFSEFRHMQPMPFLVFVGGVVISLCGVVLHSTHRHYLEGQMNESQQQSRVGIPAPTPTPSLTPPETYSPALGARAGPQESRGGRRGPNETTKLLPRSATEP